MLPTMLVCSVILVSNSLTWSRRRRASSAMSGPAGRLISERLPALKFCDSPQLPAVAFLFSGNLIATAEQQGEPVALGWGQRRRGGDHLRDVDLKAFGLQVLPSCDQVGVVRGAGSGQ